MHILDDHSGLSVRARRLLERTGTRCQSPASRIPTEFLLLPDGSGRQIRTPMLLVLRREGFDDRYGGLRYQVRRSRLVGGERHETRTAWEFDLGALMRPDPMGGWTFEWSGERLPSAFHYLVHSDGRVGVDDGTPVFLEIAPSVPALIESHALTDMVAGWDQCGLDVDRFELARRLDGLSEVREASGPTVRWRVSDDVVVQEFRHWSSTSPRRPRAFIWTRDAAGRRRVESAAARMVSVRTVERLR
ncbi:hypothetical protein AB0M29_15060 [Streptomyces sp. NPDC051976]|uniref:hypothetical protein n=1 Tax=Streptomyces sp. NPDC051976 TaxID=3154947 RepID=UPI003424A667